jgi:hypothetical protein
MALCPMSLQDPPQRRSRDQRPGEGERPGDAQRGCEQCLAITGSSWLRAERNFDLTRFGFPEYGMRAGALAVPWRPRWACWASTTASHFSPLSRVPAHRARTE